jgi:hypothetical protein
MSAEWFAIAAGILGGAMALRGLYVLASRKAAKTGERASLVFLWALSFLFLVHGLGLCVITALVWSGAALFGVPLPEPERLLMKRMMLSGIVSVVFAAIGLQARRRPAAGNPPS